jgi:hypothetical protein
MWRCHSRFGRAALLAFATVAERQSLTELSARLVEYGAATTMTRGEPKELNQAMVDGHWMDVSVSR